MKLDVQSVLLGEPEISFKNPVAPNRLVWLWHCSTHNCKNSRNNLWRSVAKPTIASKSLKRTKKLMRYDDKVVFGWQQIEDTYDRQEINRRKFKHAPRGNEELCYQSVHLDGLTLMNASYAKAPFTKTTLSQLSAFCAEQLDINFDPKSVKYGISVYSRFMGYAKTFREALSKLKTEGVELTTGQGEVLATICTLEFNTVMCSIFNERFLNRNWKLTPDNIVDEKKELETSLQFLCNWMMEKEQFMSINPSLGVKSWEQHLLATKTYKNIRIGVSGFLGYAKQVLKLEGVEFVPALHSNQSILEAYFSSLRYQHNDTAAKMGRSAAGDNLKRTIKNGVKSLMTVKERKEKRSLTYKSWDETGSNRLESNTTVPYMKATRPQPKTTFSSIVKSGLEARLLNGGFVQLLLSDPTFVGFSKQSIDTTREPFFKKIVSRDFVSQEQFDLGCQRIVDHLYIALDTAVDIKCTANYRRYYHAHILRISTTENITLLMKSHVVGLDDSLGMAILYQVLSNSMLKYIPKIFISKFPPRADPLIANDWKIAQATEMNRFVGWALYDVRTKTRKRKRNGMIDECEADSILTLLKVMSAFEHEIVDNEDYLNKYYAPIDRIYNEGWLTLVSPKFADLGHKVLISIVEHIDVDTVMSERENCVKNAREKINEDVKNHLMRTFLELTEDMDILEETRINLFLKLVRKTVNCRVGALIRYYKSITINRGTKGENSSVFREEKRVTTGVKAAKTRKISKDEKFQIV